MRCVSLPLLIHRPAELARRLWERHNPACGFDWDTFYQLYSGWPRLLIDTPNLFLAARPVKWAEVGPGINFEHIWPLDECDTWYVWAFVGDLARVWESIPFELPNVCYRRTNDSLHFHRLARVKKLSLGVSLTNL